MNNKLFQIVFSSRPRWVRRTLPVGAGVPHLLHHLHRLLQPHRQDNLVRIGGKRKRPILSGAEFESFLSIICPGAWW